MEEYLDVGIGEVKVTLSPAVLRTHLGSCVGVVIYDPKTKWGGIAHVVSPDSVGALGKVSTHYADIAVPTLIEMLVENGCRKSNLVCHIGGGGCMFPGAGEMMDIGKKNIEAVKKILEDEDIPIQQDITGGNCSTSITFYTETGIVEFDRKESNLRIIINKEKEYNNSWIDQSVGQLKGLEDYIQSKLNELLEEKTGRIDSEKLRRAIRFYSAMNQVSQLAGCVAYTKIMNEFKKR